MKKVLVVDDNQLTRHLVSDLLVELGLEPVPCGSADRALLELERLRPAACVVDHVMPGMTGAELVRAIRTHRNPELRWVHVVAASMGTAQEVVDAGANAGLTKPVTLDGLRAALRPVCRAR